MVENEEENDDDCLGRGSYYNTMLMLGEDDEDAPGDYFFSSERSAHRQAGVEIGDIQSQKNLIPKFRTETLQHKLSNIYGHDFGSLPFDMADTVNDNSYLIPPEKRALVEKNYQLLLAVRLFQESMVSIYGPVGRRVMTAEVRDQMLREGLTASLITQLHTDAVNLYKAEKTAKLEKMETISDVLRSETNKARILSVEKYSRHKYPSYNSDSRPVSGNRSKLVSVDLSDDASLNSSLKMEDPSFHEVELVSSAEELEFVSDYKTSVLDAKRAFAKNWVVMQAAAYELKLISEDTQMAQSDVDTIDSRDTFVRLTIAPDGGDVNSVAPDAAAGAGMDETEAQLLQLGDEVKKVSDVESFYRDLRKRPKAEFKDPVLIKDIEATIDILIKEMVKQRKDVEKQIRYCKGMRLKTKIMSRPIPRLLSYAVSQRRKSTGDGGDASPGSNNNSSNSNSRTDNVSSDSSHT